MKTYITIEHDGSQGIQSISEALFEKRFYWESGADMNTLKNYYGEFIEKAKAYFFRETGLKSLDGYDFEADILKAYDAVYIDNLESAMYKEMKESFLDSNFSDLAGFEPKKVYYVNDNRDKCEFYEAEEVCIEFNMSDCMKSNNFADGWGYEGGHYNNKRDYVEDYIESLELEHENPDFDGYWHGWNSCPDDDDCFSMFKEYNESIYEALCDRKKKQTKLAAMIKNRVPLYARVVI